ncbi:MAG: aminopeptidase P family protein [Deltaproteobacteria bacterium]|nr:aminopeptidase P family protein [Deltaproteobacteria bacterium]
MKRAQLIVADSEKDANILYATRFFAPDPFIFLRIEGRKFIVLSDLEMDRGKKQASVDAVLSSSEIAKKLKSQGVVSSFEEIIVHLLRQYRVKSVEVPSSFSIRLADALRKKGFQIQSKPDPFFEERQFKRADEIAAIEASVRAVEVGFEKGVQALKRARVRQDRRLTLDGDVLTSERLRAIINTTILSLGFIPSNTIVACGKQSADPHERGSGPLRAGEPIIVDIFPRCEKTGYYGDFTRTVVKGGASPRLREMYDAVLQGQRWAIRQVQDGVSGAPIHQGLLDLFRSKGFPTGEVDGRREGFFHGTGHGVGLEIHEAPRISSVPAILRKGHVVTVEPGLYYSDLGGVRLEDIVVVTEKSARNLMKYQKVFEI